MHTIKEHTCLAEGPSAERMAVRLSQCTLESRQFAITAGYGELLTLGGDAVDGEERVENDADDCHVEDGDDS
ncbi:hypothetical protein PRIPAC_95012 [Pristionchus pacificus]|uniref:Uncharacterized protein n=1 Tax=Pristionchus pacificus TaxID=54126 RepID=A0A2A6BAK0_PRIPA|nr:hypothetical protein PRIPAC_95012 [Pristionchus pacificus]|eukprot:PDM62894.1 hypothetical protein PRIPAC_50109 [Pristionchus pacificus]